MSRSIAGWSNPSSKLIHFTSPFVPNAPSGLELLRVSVNGIFVTWFPPDYDNGARVDYYELDLRPMSADDDDGKEEVVAEEYEEELKAREETAEERQKARAEHKKQVDAMKSQNKFHRRIKHKDVHNR